MMSEQKEATGQLTYAIPDGGARFALTRADGTPVRVGERLTDFEGDVFEVKSVRFEEFHGYETGWIVGTWRVFDGVPSRSMASEESYQCSAHMFPGVEWRVSE